MKIFVVNCGSSSIKYQLINMEDESVIAKGLVERIGIDGSVLTHTPAGKDKVRMESEIPDHVDIIFQIQFIRYIRCCIMKDGMTEMLPHIAIRYLLIMKKGERNFKRC